MKLAEELKKLEVIKKGKFVLASGKISDFYVDMKKVLGYPQTSQLVCNELCKIINKKTTCIASIGYGGLPLAARVSFKLGLPLVVVREKPRKHGLKNLIDGYVPTNKDKVAIVDDVFTMGTSMSKILKALAKTNAKILAGYVVVNRGNASKFEVPIKSLVTLADLTIYQK
ncbi:MAG: phosphoribosyltransferase family protein [Candidatus Taylorbacteria bacterium]|nr:phosphoribosyltransferase family protein [Candidatus Taylorbacteria bacterium]